MANENGARLRFRPAGSAARQHGAPEYGPLGTGCPAVEQAVTALYKAQNEESFWTLMNALNYALELDTRVLVPLQAAPDAEKGGASWAEHPVPAEKARDLPLWTLRTQKGKNYLPIFTSVKTAEADQGTAARPMAELLLVDAMQKVLDSKEMDGIVLDPWTTSATLDASLLNGLLHASRDTDEPGEEELHKGSQAALAGPTRSTTTSRQPNRAEPKHFPCWESCCMRARASAAVRCRPAGCGKRPPRPGMCWP